MQVETQIKLNKFIARDYQIPFVEAFLDPRGKCKRFICCWPRRAGKDLCGFNLCFRRALLEVGTHLYVFPTFTSGRAILWDAITNDGQRVIDMIPAELVDSRNEQLMRIKLITGSVIQVAGSDNFDQSLVGRNAKGIIFSEYALQDERSYQFCRPILNANDGYACFLSTPRGKNHFYTMYEIARNSPEDWFLSRLTVEDTGHIPLHLIEKEKLSGEMSEDLIQQEYYCSFEMGVEGAYYTRYIDEARLKNRIGIVPWQAGFQVHTAWDLGVRDSTAIIFFQVIGQIVNIIDCYENSKQGLEYYIKVIQNKPYSYGKHFAPHDIAVTEFGTGMTRVEKARQLGLKFQMRGESSAVPNVSIMDGIESVRSAFSKIWIDQASCGPLIKALENYRQEYDVKRKVYKSNPLHSWASHMSDAMRYLCLSLSQIRDGSSPEDIERRYREAMYGDRHNLPPFFRDKLNEY